MKICRKGQMLQNQTEFSTNNVENQTISHLISERK